jgi:hypothetical protein
MVFANWDSECRSRRDRRNGYTGQQLAGTQLKLGVNENRVLVQFSLRWESRGTVNGVILIYPNLSGAKNAS